MCYHKRATLRNHDRNISERTKSNSIKEAFSWQKKEKQAVWLYPEVKELLTTHMAAANAMSQSDFIEKAIRFYAGYLDCNSENMTEYLGETVSAVIDGIVKGSEQRISRALFKLAVQSAIQSHILAAVTDVDETDVGKLYGMCTEDVRRTNGIIDFRNAYKYQKED